MIINTESPDQPEVAAMLARLAAHCAALYPAASNHPMPAGALRGDDVLFLVARDIDGRAVGCAALVNQDGYGELKSVFVDAAVRGQGAGRKLLEHIVMFAAMSGLRTLRLETGTLQPEALRLYERGGFVRCAPFGGYPDSPWSVFMEKHL